MKTFGKKAVVRIVFGISHSKKYVVEWKSGGSMTESTRGLRLPNVFGQRNVSGPPKEKRRPHEVLLIVMLICQQFMIFIMIPRNRPQKKRLITVYKRHE